MIASWFRYWRTKTLFRRAAQSLDVTAFCKGVKSAVDF